MCPECNKPITNCTCNTKKKISPTDGIVRISCSTKGRKGKGMTIITGIPLEHTKLASLAKQLKQKCSAGGTIKDGIIEIQGDHRDFLLAKLKKLGYTVKRSGG